MKDQRGCDPSLISNKGTIYKTSGKYIAEKEVSILFSDIIRDALSRQGYIVVSENSDYNLSGDIIKFDSNTLMGFWSGDIEANIQTSLKLVDISNGNIVWAEIISGYGKREHILIDSLQFRKEAIDKAIYNYIEKLAASESFRKALQR
ncbi:MAG: hypothetical protein HQL08_08775 [Nitrospirae bacterium]|nr:hypothetical protein [Nitrospirota bacterium]